MPTNSLLVEWGPAHLRPEAEQSQTNELEFSERPDDN